VDFQEMFIAYLAEKAGEVTAGKKRKTVKAEDISKSPSETPHDST
jgi:histone H3/H4